MLADCLRSAMLSGSADGLWTSRTPDTLCAVGLCPSRNLWGRAEIGMRCGVARRTKTHPISRPAVVR